MLPPSSLLIEYVGTIFHILRQKSSFVRYHQEQSPYLWFEWNQASAAQKVSTLMISLAGLMIALRQHGKNATSFAVRPRGCLKLQLLSIE